MRAQFVPFQELLNNLNLFHQAVSDHAASLPPGQERTMVEQLLTEWEKSRAEVEKVVPQAFGAMKQDCEKMESQGNALKDKLEGFIAELKSKAEQAATVVPVMPAAPTVAEAVIDPNLGAVLGAELLQRFGRVAKPTPAGDDLEGSVATAWVEPTAPESAPAAKPQAAAPPAKPQAAAPKQKPKKPDNPDDDIWEGLSRMED